MLFNGNTLLNSSRPSTCHSVFCKHSPCHWGQTLDTLPSSQRKYCWFTMTLQIQPALLTLAPPAQMLPWQQLLCYGLGEGLRGQMTKISYSKKRDILGIDFNSNFVQTDLSCTGVTTHCDQHLRERETETERDTHTRSSTSTLANMKGMWQCWLLQKQLNPPSVTKQQNINNEAKHCLHAPNSTHRNYINTWPEVHLPLTVFRPHTLRQLYSSN